LPGDVANMSLGGPTDQSIDDAVFAAAEAGILFSLAAGNEGTDANTRSPARVNHENVYTVSAIGSGDSFASFSNYGNPPVDRAAPGVGIVSLKRGGGTDTKSGTSMAAPHVAGLLILQGNAGCDGTANGDPDGTDGDGGNGDAIAHLEGFSCPSPGPSS
jgi:subtilisin family serine protease